MSYAKLKGKIIEVFGTYYNFANAMGMHKDSLSAKLKNKTPWKREEIELACELLRIPIQDVYIYFFTQKVEISQHLEGEYQNERIADI